MTVTGWFGCSLWWMLSRKGSDRQSQRRNSSWYCSSSRGATYHGRGIVGCRRTNVTPSGRTCSAQPTASASWPSTSIETKGLSPELCLILQILLNFQMKRPESLKHWVVGNDAFLPVLACQSARKSSCAESTANSTILHLYHWQTTSMCTCEIVYQSAKCRLKCNVCGAYIWYSTFITILHIQYAVLQTTRCQTGCKSQVCGKGGSKADSLSHGLSELWARRLQ